jgi:hypothetical protein
MDGKVKLAIIVSILALVLFTGKDKAKSLSGLSKRRARRLFYISNGKVIPRSQVDSARRMARSGYGKVFAVWAYNADEAREYIRQGKAETVSGLGNLADCKKIKMRNEAYRILEEFKKEHGRRFFSDKDFKEHPEIFQALSDTENEIKKFDGKKVQLTYRSTSDWTVNSGEKIGKIKVDDKGHIRFFEGGKTSKFQYLDSGFFEGNYATIIPITIEEMKSGKTCKKTQKMIPEKAGQMTLFGGVKEMEPWKMTSWEYRKDFLKNRGFDPTPGNHEYEVSRAVRDNKPVPKDVLDEYPDLIKTWFRSPYEMTSKEFYNTNKRFEDEIERVHKLKNDILESESEIPKSRHRRIDIILQSPEGERQKYLVDKYNQIDIPLGKEILKIERTNHKDVVLKAIKEGKSIPERVLREYPDLKRKTIPEQTSFTDRSQMTLFGDLGYKGWDEEGAIRATIKAIDKFQGKPAYVYATYSGIKSTHIKPPFGQPHYRVNPDGSVDQVIHSKGVTTEKTIINPKYKTIESKSKGQMTLFGGLSAAPTGNEIYMQSSPISKELQHRFEQTTFYPYDMNKEFNESVEAKETEAINKLKAYGYKEIPEDVQTALAYYRKSLYDFLVTKASQVPGPMITGPSKYNYNKLDKSIAREDKALQSIETAKDYLEKAVKRNTKGKSTTVQQDSRTRWKAEAIHTPKKEFANKVFQAAYDKANPNLKEDYDNGVFVTEIKNKGRKFHKELIDEAVAEGIAIDPIVKKDYPEKFGIEPQVKAKKPKTDAFYDEFIKKQQESERIAKEWSRPSIEKSEAIQKRIDERDKPKAKLIPEEKGQMTLFGRLPMPKVRIYSHG